MASIVSNPNVVISSPNGTFIGYMYLGDSISIPDESNYLGNYIKANDEIKLLSVSRVFSYNFDRKHIFMSPQYFATTHAVFSTETKTFNNTALLTLNNPVDATDCICKFSYVYEICLIADLRNREYYAEALSEAHLP